MTCYRMEQAQAQKITRFDIEPLKSLAGADIYVHGDLNDVSSFRFNICSFNDDNEKFKNDGAEATAMLSRSRGKKYDF